MKTTLANFKVEKPTIEKLSFTEARTLLDKLFSSINNGMASYKQRQILDKHGFPSEVKFEAAKATIDRIAKSGWTLRAPSRPTIEPTQTLEEVPF